MRKMVTLLKPLQQEEQFLLYRSEPNSKQSNALVGYLRGNFANEESFFYTWFDNNQALKNEIFKREFDALINALRSTVLESFTAMKEYCKTTKKSVLKGDYTCETGVSAENDMYFYAIRFIPLQGDYNVYIHCYVKELLK